MQLSKSVLTASISLCIVSTSHLLTNITYGAENQANITNTKNSDNGNKFIYFAGKKISVGASEVEFKKKYPAFRPVTYNMPAGIKTYSGLNNNANALFYNGSLACVAIGWSGAVPEDAPKSIVKHQEQLMKGFKETKNETKPDEDYPMYEYYRYDYVNGSLIAKLSGTARGGRIIGDCNVVCDERVANELKAKEPSLAEFWF
jgi:hypothetical protein